jgi:hypothetical protein
MTGVSLSRKLGAGALFTVAVPIAYHYCFAPSSPSLPSALSASELSTLSELTLPPRRSLSSPGHCSSAVSLLHREGACLLLDVLPPSTISSLSSLEASLFNRYHVIPSSAVRAGRQPPSKSRWQRGSPRRLHLDLQQLPLSESASFRAVATSFEPLVREFLASQTGGDEDADKGSRIVQTEMQIVASLPRSEVQPWHADNLRGGGM